MTEVLIAAGFLLVAAVLGAPLPLLVERVADLGAPTSHEPLERAAMNDLLAAFQGAPEACANLAHSLAELCDSFAMLNRTCLHETARREFDGMIAEGYSPSAAMARVSVLCH